MLYNKDVFSLYQIIEGYKLAIALYRYHAITAIGTVRIAANGTDSPILSYKLAQGNTLCINEI